MESFRVNTTILTAAKIIFFKGLKMRKRIMTGIKFSICRVRGLVCYKMRDERNQTPGSNPYHKSIPIIKQNRASGGGWHWCPYMLSSSAISAFLSSS